MRSSSRRCRLSDRECCALCGRSPVFADVDPDAQSHSADRGSALTDRTRAVIVVDQAARPPAWTRCARSATRAGNRDRRMPPARRDRTIGCRPAGAGAALAPFSASSRACSYIRRRRYGHHAGRGIAARLRRLRDHGMDASAASGTQPPTGHRALPETGYNFRMTDIQAAIGLVQLGSSRPRLPGAAIWPGGTRGCCPGSPGYGRSTIPRTGEPTSSPSGCCCQPTPRLAGTGCSGCSPRAYPRDGESWPPIWSRPTRRPVGASCDRAHHQRSLILPLFHQMTASQQEQVVSVVTSALTNSAPEMSVS